MAKKVGIISLGCAKNLVDSEQMLSLLDDAGFEFVSDLEDVDAVVINTCGFIESAREEAYENIREAGYFSLSLFFSSSISLSFESPLGITQSSAFSKRYSEFFQDGKMKSISVPTNRQKVSLESFFSSERVLKV